MRISTTLSVIFFFILNSLHGQIDASMSLKHALINIENKNYKQAIIKFKEAESYIKALYPSQKKEYYEYLNHFGLCYYNEGDFQNAEKIFSTPLKEKKLDYDSESALALLNNLAATQIETYNYQSAENIYKILIEDKTKKYGELSENVALTSINLGELYLQKGQFFEAEKQLKLATYNLKTLNKCNTKLYAQALHNLGSLYLSIGFYKDAENVVKEAIKIKKSINSEIDKSLITSLLNLNLCYLSLGKNKEAIELSKSILSICNESELSLDNEILNAKLNLAEGYKQQNEIQNASSIYEDLIVKIDQKSNPEAFYSAMYKYSAIQTQAQNFNKAQIGFEKCLTFFNLNTAKYSTEIASTSLQLAFALLGNNQTIKSDQLVRKALNSRILYIKNKFNILSEKEKISFINKNSFFLETFKEYCFKRIKEGENSFSQDLLDFEIAFKGIVLESSSSFKSKILASKDSSLLNKYNQWEMKRNMLSALNNQKGQIDNFKKLEEEIATIEKNLIENSSKIALQTNVSVSDIKNNLKPDEIFVDIIRFQFSKTKVCYGALLLTKNSTIPKFIELPDSNLLEKRFYKYYINAIKNKIEDTISYNHFWKRIENEIDVKTKKIYLSADGIYNQLSIASFYDFAHRQFVIEKYDIETITSAKEIINKSESNIQKQKLFVLIGRPEYVDVNNQENGSQNIPLSDLPGTEKEVKNIAAVLNSKNISNTILLGSKADEQAINKLTNPSVLHIASHGYFKPSTESNSPNDALLRSGIVLAHVNTQKPVDGLFTAYELINMELMQTDLVVFSACETGLGEIMNGEGVYGLQRAAKIAGAKSVIYSLWTVNDNASQELMTQFYKSWLSTNNKREAFRNAQLEVLKKYKHPYFWAAFCLNGH